jgi:general L-amino acid transport system ATP-binding protein
MAENGNGPDAPMIVLRGVYKWFGAFQVLKDINLDVWRGQRIVVCGPSGSGKSTMIRCVNRLEEHQRGHIVVDGIELTHDVRNIDAIRREVGMVFQHFNLFPHLTVLENLTLAPMWVRKLPKAEAEETAKIYLERVGIPEQAQKYPGQLSGGQQQRVAIARALMQQPRLILADEPVASLDPALRHSVMRHIESLNRDEGMTVMCSLHDIDLVTRYATRMVALRDGRLVWEGVPGQFDQATFKDIYGEEAQPASNTGF